MSKTVLNRLVKLKLTLPSSPLEQSLGVHPVHKYFQRRSFVSAKSTQSYMHMGVSYVIVDPK